jgi:predicted transposase YbfD/YdcC
MERPIISLMDYFVELPDPRIDRRKLHSLTDILCITVCAVICGAQHWTQVEEFGLAKEEWFKTFLRLENGIPSHDTFGDFFAALNPKIFEKCFIKWVQAISERSLGDIVSVDGKALRKSFDTASGKAAIHMVSAFSSANGIVLGQLKINDKSNEITAVPELLKLLILEGTIVTTDALNCQKDIAATIVEQGADYVLTLKENHPCLYADVELYFNTPSLSRQSTDPGVEKGHGRIETRRYSLNTDIEWLDQKSDWKNLRGIGMVESTREINGTISTERRYYMTSLADLNDFSRAVRRHWSVENQLHWVLDVAFREDLSRVRIENAAENFSIMRRIALNLLKQEKTSKIGIESKRLKAGWNHHYLLKVLKV